jgi:hypothetical protein
MFKRLRRRDHTAFRHKEAPLSVLDVFFESDGLHPGLERNGSSRVVHSDVGVGKAQKVSEQAVEVTLESDAHRE